METPLIWRYGKVSAGYHEEIWPLKGFQSDAASLRAPQLKRGVEELETVQSKATMMIKECKKSNLGGKGVTELKKIEPAKVRQII